MAAVTAAPWHALAELATAAAMDNDDAAARLEEISDLPPLVQRIVAGHLKNAARAQREAARHLADAEKMIDLYGSQS
jgi:hypothetical protein